MAKPIAKKKATFFWQGVLIVLPVVVLAAVGLVSMRQDRILAELEAKQRAQSFADDLAGQIWSALATHTNLEDLELPFFQMDRAGQLIFPPPYDPVPIPQPFDLATLTAEQAGHWQAAQRDSIEKPANGAAIESWEKFIRSNPPESFKAAAHFSLALLLARQGRTLPALDQLDQVTTKFPNAKGESGLPLLPMALRKQLELASSQTNFSLQSFETQLMAFGSNVVFHPTPVTSFLLDQMPALEAKLGLSGRSQRWRKEWNRHEQARALYAAARSHFQTNFSRSVPLPQAATAAGKPEEGVKPTAKALLSLGTPPQFTDITVPRLFWLTFKEIRFSERATHSPTTSKGKTAVRSFGEWPPEIDAHRLPPHTPITNIDGGIPVRMVDASGAGRAFFIADHNVDQTWLAVRRDEEPNRIQILCWPVQNLNAGFVDEQRNRIVPVANALTNVAKRLPEYFDISLDLAGTTIISSNSLEVVTYRSGGKGGGYYWAKTRPATPPAILATASKSEGGTEFLRVAVHLVGPEILYAAQRGRTVWFGLLIGVSAAAALIGFLAAWRAFRKQQRLSEMKSNFVSSVSHELRAPIASVRLMAEGLARGKIQESQKQNEYFRFIVQECRRLSSLIENVLDFSRIEQGRKQYEFEPTDLVALAQQTAKLMEPNAAEKNITIATHVPADAVVADVDGKAIQQALVNLIDNAIKHSPSGATVAVGLECPSRRTGVAPVSDLSCDKISTALAPAAGFVDANKMKSETAATAVLLWIEDHGDGIPPEEHERIFERFYRRGSELRRETQGVGIGLSIVKHIVEAHGGRVRVRSAVGEGSRFTIELPIEKTPSTNFQ